MFHVKEAAQLSGVSVKNSTSLRQNRAFSTC